MGFWWLLVGDCCSHCWDSMLSHMGRWSNQYINIPGPANEQKKKVVLVNDPVFSQLTYFGSDRAIQPKRPKMAEIWLKSNFLCVSMVSHPITSLSFTKVTLVALIHPWRVWLDPWGLRFRAWAPAMLCLLFFAGVVHCSGIGCQLAEISMLYDTCCSDSGSQRCTIWDRCVFVCVWDSTHTTIYLALFTTPKAVMQNTYDSHVFTPQIWDGNSPQNSKSSIFKFFRTKTAPQIGRKNPQSAHKNPQTGANQDFCPDVFWQNVFYRSKARFKWQILLI